MGVSKNKSIVSLCAVLFMSQYSLLMPLMRYFKPALLVAASGLLILSFLIFNESKSDIVLPVLFLMLIHCVGVSIRVLCGDTLQLLTYGLMIPISAMAVFLFDGEVADWLQYAIIIAFINVLVNCWIPFTSSYEYMRFGYGMILSTVIGIEYAYCYWNQLTFIRRLAVLLLIAVSGLESLLFGSRGCIVVAVLCVLQLLLFFGEGPSIKKLGILTIITIGCFNLTSITSYLEQLANRYGISSYLIRKLRMQLERGLVSASSGRFEIYTSTLDKILANPMVGHQIDNIGEAGDYAHNLFLQVWLDWGAFGLLVLLVALFLVIRTLMNKKIPVADRLLLSTLTAASIGRLFFSSTYWLRPEFWMMLSLMLWLRHKYLNGQAVAGTYFTSKVSRAAF